MTTTPNPEFSFAITGERELTISRVFDAPRELVFLAYSTAEHQQAWVGPRYLKNRDFELDFRVGGRYRWVQEGPDGSLYTFTGEILELTPLEREEMSATDMVREDLLDVREGVWTDGQLAIVRTAAMDPQVQRIFVNAAIKRAMCRAAAGEPWMRKVRPMYGHNYHFHIRLSCPPGQSDCQAQDPTPPGDGCDSSLAWWFKPEVLHPKPNPFAKPKPPMTMAALPGECRAVLGAR